MIDALVASILAALLLAAPVRAVRPGGLLAFLAPRWQTWQIFKPRWLNDKISGGCASCTAFWWVGIPAAVLVALFTPGVPLGPLLLNPWALAVPFCVAVLSEILISAK